MKIKAKLFLGIGLLFAMIVLLTAIGSIYINKLSADTKNILVANYNTLDYSRKMQIALNNGIKATEHNNLFQVNLKLQQNNVTEVGEKELTANLALHYEQLQKNPADTFSIKLVRSDIFNIMLLNMQAIERKSKIAGATADNSIFGVTIIGTLCFLPAAYFLKINPE